MMLGRFRLNVKHFFSRFARLALRAAVSYKLEALEPLRLLAFSLLLVACSLLLLTADESGG